MNDVLPAIYQLELTAACDLQCPMCLRTTALNRKPGLLPLAMLEEMCERQEFTNTRYIELQMAGEPTIHPKLSEIIDILHGQKVMVGLSTHGLTLHKPKILAALLKLDALTISLDSVDPVVYAGMRTPGKLEDLVKNVDLLLNARGCYSTQPLIDLQLVKSPLIKGSGHLEAAEEFARARGWLSRAGVRLRVVDDSFMEMDGRMPIGSMARPAVACERPFNRVSITQDGDVVSCCFIFSPNRKDVTWYGNLAEQTLRDIWNGSRCAEMRRQHIKRQLTGECLKCYQWSGHDVHSDIVSTILSARES